MPFFAAEKQVLEAYITECKTLVDQIRVSVDLVASREAEIIADGYKNKTIKPIVVAVKKLAVPLGQVHFKNSSGTISVSVDPVSAELDTYVRSKISDLISIDMTASVVEPLKRKQLLEKQKLSKNYGISLTAFKKMMEIYSYSQTDFVFTSDISLTIADGFKIKNTSIG